MIPVYLHKEHIRFDTFLRLKMDEFECRVNNVRNERQRSTKRT
jgi:hypothetical protein